MRVNIVGHNVKVNLEAIGLTILWDTNKIVAIEASAGLFNRTAGLCGTLDQHPENDFMSKNGAVHKVHRFYFYRASDFCYIIGLLALDDFNVRGCVASAELRPIEMHG